ncbi:hypothetical protein [Halomonas stenophila]|uniref:Uncharacterized protein n=1 Tax=Halomonas stenophila TaxID=795312 RepID=A0A7W5EUN2_9GAMM|nr:hypothetical protein [Halomonas stenophila]MBB3231693.1 hypothetical protein [Halomonas stenophila]
MASDDVRLTSAGVEVLTDDVHEGGARLTSAGVEVLTDDVHEGGARLTSAGVEVLAGVPSKPGIAVLNFETFNDSEDGFDIYRDTQPLDPNSLPAPINAATLQRADLAPPTGESGLWYEDTTVVPGTNYHYIIGTHIGSLERLGEEFQVFAYEMVES